MEARPLQAGVAEIELKPEVGLATGDGAPWAKGQLYPLFVKALVLSNSETAVAIVTLDALGIDRPDATAAAALAEARCGVPAGAIIITCSHTHVAPSMLPTLHTYRTTFNPAFDAAAQGRERAWVEHIIETIADAVAQAQAAQQPASLGVVTANLPWLVFNRRRKTRDYGVWTHWMRIPPDQAYDVEGPIDPDFGLLVVRDARHRPLCLLWNFTGHNSFNFGDRYSGDLTYTVQAALDERMGTHVPCLYTPACSGNTNYFDYGKPEGLTKATEGVADAIMAIYREACTLPEVKLGARKAELFFAQRDFARYWWQDDIAQKLPRWNDYGATEVARFRAEADRQATYQTDVVALRLGNTALVAFPGEMFVEFGLMLKARSPARHTYAAIYANDYAGYVATREAFVNGSYEVWPALNARIGREGGYLMVDKAIELLEELFAD